MLPFQVKNLRKNAENPGRRAPERVPLPGLLSVIWYVVFKPKAHRRPVPGCGSQRMLHALERRSHPADHGPSFASLYSPFCRYATSSPDRGKSLLAGGGQLNCNSRMGQIKNALAQCAKTAPTVDIPTGWDLQQRRPRPVADAGRSCWGSGQQDASAAQGTHGCWEPQPGALKKSPLGSFLPPAGGRVPSIPRTGQNGSNHGRHSWPLGPAG